MRSRVIATLSAIVLLVSACGTGSAPASPAATFGPFDRATVDRLMAQGLSESEALILAMTTVTVVSADDHSAHLVEAFPTGDRADITINVSPAASGDPSAIETTSAATADGFTFTLRYFVRRGTTLTDPGSASRADTAYAGGVRLALAWMPHPEPLIAAEAESDLDVIVQATVKEGAKAVFDEYVEKMETYLKAEGAVEPFVEYFKAVGGLFEAEDLSREYKTMNLRIDALERCATNPTNALTVQAYQDDPTYKDRTLQQVAETRTEIKVNAAAAFLAVMDSLAADLVKVPLLRIATGVGTAWSKHALNGLSEQRISDLEQSIVECKDETPAPPSAGTPPLETTGSTGSTCPPGGVGPACCPVSGCGTPGASLSLATRIAGTITWQLATELQSVSGTATMTLLSTNDFDFVIQPGGTYVLDVQTNDCGSGHVAGVLEQGNITGDVPPLLPGHGRVGVVGGPGRNLSTSIDINDSYACPDDQPHGTRVLGFPGCPFYTKVEGKFVAGSPGTYDFSCETHGENGSTGSVQGTLGPSP